MAERGARAAGEVAPRDPPLGLGRPGHHPGGHPARRRRRGHRPRGHRDAELRPRGPRRRLEGRGHRRRRRDRLSRGHAPPASPSASRRRPSTPTPPSRCPAASSSTTTGSCRRRRCPSRRVVGLPFTQLAETELGKAIAANIVMLGALQELSGVIGAEPLADAVRRRLPAKIVELNLKALQLGHDRPSRRDERARARRSAPGPRRPLRREPRHRRRRRRGARGRGVLPGRARRRRVAPPAVPRRRHRRSASPRSPSGCCSPTATPCCSSARGPRAPAAGARAT